MEAHHYLYKLALRERKKRNQSQNILRWHGIRSTSCRRKYICYICDEVIDTDSAKWKPTVHASKAIERHKFIHLKNVLAIL